MLPINLCVFVKLCNSCCKVFYLCYESSVSGSVKVKPGGDLYSLCLSVTF